MNQKSWHTLPSSKMKMLNGAGLNLEASKYGPEFELPLTISLSIRKEIFNTSKNSSCYTRRAVLFYEREESLVPLVLLFTFCCLRSNLLLGAIAFGDWTVVLNAFSVPRTETVKALVT